MTITVDDFEVFCRRSFMAALGVIERLGDDRINRRPQATAGTSPFALMTHMLGACEFWVGHIVLGEPTERIRDDEFTASGTVAELQTAVHAWLDRLAERKPRLAATTNLAGTPKTQVPLDGAWTVGAALLHTYEELAQHLGHLEITADLVELD